jgi:glycogen operon protein
VEGETDDPAVQARRRADLKALLATLFASTGPIMLTAGDEFGRTQLGNNNAYCQDNPLGWADWEGRDTDLEAYVASLAAQRAARGAAFAEFPQDGQWLAPSGAPMTGADWEDPAGDGFTFVPADPAAFPVLSLCRSERRFTVSG